MKTEDPNDGTLNAEAILTELAGSLRDFESAPRSERMRRVREKMHSIAGPPSGSAPPVIGELRSLLRESRSDQDTAHVATSTSEQSDVENLQDQSNHLKLASIALRELNALSDELLGTCERGITSVEEIRRLKESLLELCTSVETALRKTWVLRRGIEEAIGRHDFDETLTPLRQGAHPIEIVRRFMDWSQSTQEQADSSRALAWSLDVLVHFPRILFSAHQHCLRPGACRLLNDNLRPDLLAGKSLPPWVPRWVISLARRHHVPFISSRVWKAYRREFFRLQTDDRMFFQMHFHKYYQEQYWREFSMLRDSRRQQPPNDQQGQK